MRNIQNSTFRPSPSRRKAGEQPGNVAKAIWVSVLKPMDRGGEEPPEGDPEAELGVHAASDAKDKDEYHKKKRIKLNSWDRGLRLMIIVLTRFTLCHEAVTFEAFQLK